jgi:heavy metal efflux system protein
MGFISLFGVSVMNGILIITYYNQLRALNTPAQQAMYDAATQRMRPMLMTAAVGLHRLLPAALSTGVGSQVQRPLATVVVGGMLIGPDHAAGRGARASDGFSARRQGADNGDRGPFPVTPRTA